MKLTRKERRTLEHAFGGARLLGAFTENEVTGIAELYADFAPFVGIVHCDGTYLLFDFSTAKKRIKREVAGHHQRWKEAQRAA